MKKYVIKHLKINKFKQADCYLNYNQKINFHHLVFNIEEATHFRTEKRANEVRNKFKHPELWEIVEVVTVE